MTAQAVVVVTTINAPTAAVRAWSDVVPLVVVGDRKTPAESFGGFPCRYVAWDATPELPSAPRDHYARKNLGYLAAMRQGCDVIVDSDDDTWPALLDHSLTPDALPRSTVTCHTSDFVNVFQGRSTLKPLWPRGFPLDALHEEASEVLDGGGTNPVGIAQLLINGDTDVDAVHRLVFGAQNVTFSRVGRLQVVPAGKFCPFNSQLTVFTRPAFPLLYLPTHVSFRFTDILRGVVAKRVLDAVGLAVAFGDPAGYQVRNEHDYFVDFLGESSMYRDVRRAWECLEGIEGTSVGELLRDSYQRLVATDVVPEIELTAVREWLTAISNVQR